MNFKGEPPQGAAGEAVKNPISLCSLLVRETAPGTGVLSHRMPSTGSEYTLYLC